ncbi:hypothetical protein X551_04317 [Methylibium sp. T29]|nr:hypothetical protein X551_04317 [Methylibium sp. T29]
MRRQPAGPRRVAAQEVEHEEAAHQPPQAGLLQVGGLDALAAVGHQVIEPLAQPAVEVAVADHHVGLEVERQAQRIEVAGAHGGPLVVGHRHLAVQRALAVLVDVHAGAQQVVVQHLRGALDDGHVGLALQDQRDLHAPPRRPAQLPQQPVAGEEVGIGDHQTVARGADHGAVVALDVLRVLAVVARDEHRLGGAGGGLRRQRRRRCATSEPAALRGGPARAPFDDGLLHEALDVRHQRAFQLHRVVLLGLGPEVGQVIGRIVDAADEGALAVHHHDLAVHAAEQVGAPAEQPRAGVEHVHAHAGLGERADEGRRQVGRAEAVDRDVDLRAVACRRQQRGMQREPDLVLEQDEGLQQHLVARRGDGLEHAREVGLAVLQQREAVAVDPAWRAHSEISAASGAWSDRCDHGLRGSTMGACTAALRT